MQGGRALLSQLRAVICSSLIATLPVSMHGSAVTHGNSRVERRGATRQLADASIVVSTTSVQWLAAMQNLHTRTG